MLKILANTVSTGFHGFREWSFFYSEAELGAGCRFHWQFYIAVPKIAPMWFPVCPCRFVHFAHNPGEGKPLEHGHLFSLHWAAHEAGFAANSVYPQKSSQSFKFSLALIFFKLLLMSLSTSWFYSLVPWGNRCIDFFFQYVFCQERGGCVLVMPYFFFPLPPVKSLLSPGDQEVPWAGLGLGVLSCVTCFAVWGFFRCCFYCFKKSISDILKYLQFAAAYFLHHLYFPAKTCWVFWWKGGDKYVAFTWAHQKFPFAGHTFPEIAFLPTKKSLI